jgi:hypothetical protein
MHIDLLRLIGDLFEWIFIRKFVRNAIQYDLFEGRGKYRSNLPRPFSLSQRSTSREKSIWTSLVNFGLNYKTNKKVPTTIIAIGSLFTFGYQSAWYLQFKDVTDSSIGIFGRIYNPKLITKPYIVTMLVLCYLCFKVALQSPKKRSNNLYPCTTNYFKFWMIQIDNYP